ncbi:styrene monooxygenase subunit StyA [Bordetella genomosp. 12]|uniref:Monooxygenase n=1 Tax=Bordetella genomosp. 12 TaxID=463035 RepID=A0A261VM11_9BORD|nr:styrene monooxygenase/indole monooxygenase family protein [Bordetella genomosp. 12]OZI74620.1 monooxygenase [Bordetella genomosp. 12]
MARKRIGIIGAGTAGLHLGLYLLKHGVDVTIHTDRKPEEYASMRLLNTVAHHSVTVAREAALGVDHWPDMGYYGHYYYIGGPQPLRFYGDLVNPSRAVDYRIYQPRLMEDFLERGGDLDYRTLDAADIPAMADAYDLIVVSTGKGPLGQMFQHRAEFSPFDRPQRLLCAALFKGIEQADIRAVTMSFSPGHGEMIEIPTVSFGGMVTALVIENIPGGDMEIVARQKYDEDPAGFMKMLLGKLRVHHPSVAERINEREFDLANSPLDILQGAVTPTVRATHMPLGNGKMALALGDVHATVDPVLGQGANMASHAAWIVGEEIVRQDVFDERFCEHVNLRRQDRVLSATRWTNFMLTNLRTLPVELQQFIGELYQNRDLADAFTDNFNYPERQWDVFSSPQRMAAWCERLKAQAADRSVPAAA